MDTKEKILQALKNVPTNRLEDLYAIVHSFSENAKKTSEPNAEILSYAVMQKDWSEADFKDFLNHTKEVREDLFNRDILL